MIKIFNPTSPGVRGRVKVTYDLADNGRPYRYLTVGNSKKAGRDNSGKISVRHKCRGNKKRYRIIDYKRTLNPNIESVAYNVESIQYDPNRTAYIALVKSNVDSKLSYVIATSGVKKGDTIFSSNTSSASLSDGTCTQLKHIPVGTNVHSIEFKPNEGAKIARSAGTFCTIAGFDGDFALLKMPSGELRKFNQNCRATTGIVSNKDHVNAKIGKAGLAFAKGRRPSVRGIAMNPVDHPMGGRTNGGKHPCSPTGVKAKGKKTRKKNHRSSVFIVKRRK